MSVLILRIYQTVLVRTVGPCQTYEGSIDCRRELNRFTVIVDIQARQHAFQNFRPSSRLDNHVTCPGIRRHETSSNPGATRRPSPGFVIRVWVNLLPKSRSGRADGLGRKEANGPATAGKPGVTVLLLCYQGVIVSSSLPGLPRLLWEGKGYIYHQHSRYQYHIIILTPDLYSTRPFWPTRTTRKSCVRCGFVIIATPPLHHQQIVDCHHFVISSRTIGKGSTKH
jgi:hypothetical protein